MADRTAVLVVGLVAGFAVGRSFVPQPDVPPPIIAAPADVPGSGVATPAAVAAPAAPAVSPPAGVERAVVERVARTGVVRVGVFGDSFGVGVWDALYRLLPESEGYEVLRFSREATGFTRYRVDDLEKRAREQLAANPVDAAVISLGVNDAQDMWDGKLYPFMSDGWKQVVGDRVDRFVAVARSTGARVYWVGLPAMRDPALDAKVQALNGFFAAHMARLGVTFIDTRRLSVDPQGRYASHLPDPRSGTPRLVRTGDGIHMIGIGYQRIVAEAVAAIRRYAAQVREAAHRPVPAAPPEGAR
ncbi:SGNH/GDSL hydrolase family protein [Sphingomonas rubra]|uniref:Uncharacterized protein n=1 Tax=Sphingomonas rubra TaxID=634430 RepID=A0A1I5RPI5_9SPHN|nr:GDSL-type esterase/lipase family protein [Sphingomonas rubra]SFP60459.1 hypothetical protein SAMN04488241_10430 [Sphingomonas rubra]